MTGTVLITGATGHIGQYLLAGKPFGVGVFALGGRHLPTGVPGTHLDIADAQALRELLDRVSPSGIIHAAAMATAEECEQDRTRAEAVNVGSTRTIVDWASAHAARVYYTSTDLVFDGKQGPYAVEAQPAPLSFYGETKYRGEVLVRELGEHGCVVRCAINYGWGPAHNPHYAEHLFHALHAGQVQNLFTDQYRSFIHTADTAEGIWRLVQNEQAGVWHLGGPEVISRYEFARMVAQRLGIPQPERLLRATRMCDLKDFIPRPGNCGFVVAPLPPDGFVPVETAVGIPRWLAEKDS